MNIQLYTRTGGRKIDIKQFLKEKNLGQREKT
jgi:hypothetical protein